MSTATQGEPNGPVEGGTLPFRRKVLYGVAGLGDSVVGNGVLAATLLYPLALKVDMAVLGLLMIVPRLWDAVTDPIMGNVSDNTRSRWGRRRPYILVGGLATGLCFFLVYAWPPLFEGKALLAWFFVIFIVFYGAHTVFSIPYNALGFELSSDYHERSRVMAYRAFFTSIGGMVAGGAMWITFREAWWTPRTGLLVLGLLFGGLSTVTFVAAALGTREAAPAQPQPRIGFIEAYRYTIQNRPFLILIAALTLYTVGLYMIIPLYSMLSIYYVFDGDKAAASNLEFYKGLLYALLMLGTIFPITWLGKRVGKKRALISCLAVGIAGTASAWFLYVPDAPYFQLVMSAVLAFSLPAVQIFPMSIIADICDADELRTGRRREGAYGAMYAFVMKLTFCIIPALSGLILNVAGIDEKLEVQDPEAVSNLRVLVSVIPPAMLTLCVLLLLKLNASEKQADAVRDALDRRSVDSMDIGVATNSSEVS